MDYPYTGANKHELAQPFIFFAKRSHRAKDCTGATQDGQKTFVCQAGNNNCDCDEKPQKYPGGRKQTGDETSCGNAPQAGCCPMAKAHEMQRDQDTGNK